MDTGDKQCKWCIHIRYSEGKLRCDRGLRIEYNGIPWFCQRDYERAVGSDDDKPTVRSEEERNRTAKRISELRESLKR
jgi:hypothetical protein